jgi:hypothetical protein
MHTRVENLGTGTKGIPRLLIKGESTEAEESDDGWLMKLVKENPNKLPAPRASWRCFFDRLEYGIPVAMRASTLTPHGALSLFTQPQTPTTPTCLNNSYQQQPVH